MLPLPTINKINDGILMLVGYKLNEGICKALNYGLEKFDKPLSKVILENNGITDKMLSFLIESLGSKSDDLVNL